MIVELSVVPIGVGESLSEHVAKAVKIIEKSGFDFKLTAMGTILKVGSFEELGKLIDRIVEEMKAECPRIYVVVKADERFKDYDLDYKVKSVEEKMGENGGKMGES
ncbi:thiamine-binding protein [Archaeoglobales archaeon]|nr:MAG: thiamine-binding protein [Archaeoglobales archaeon]